MKNGPYILSKAPYNYPGKKYRGKYAYEHHLVWWRSTGNVPEFGFDIHHKNGNKHDNRIENLEKISHSEHAKEHGANKIAYEVSTICGWCDKWFVLPTRHYNVRVKQTKSGYLFCCRSHQVKYQQNFKIFQDAGQVNGADC